MIPETGSIAIATSVSIGEIVSIIISIPIRVVTDVMICVIDWLSDIPSVSTSFVTLESTSPFVFLSK